jgi:hypothetical protein
MSIDYDEEARRIALDALFETAKPVDLDYKGFRVYHAQGHKGQVPGYPLFILARDGKIRRASIHESYDIMGMLGQECK